MLEENQAAKFNEIMVGATMRIEGWDKITTDIEKYMKIRGFLLAAFEVVEGITPQPVRVVMQANRKKLAATEVICEFEELMNFLVEGQIFSTTLLSNLDDKKIPDYAAPHRAVNLLDRMFRLNEKGDYSEDQLSALGAAFSVELRTLEGQLKNIDWKQGWGDKAEE